MPKRVTVSRALTTQREAVEEIELHTFGDASGKGVCAAIYAIVKQSGDTNVGLVAARAILAKQDSPRTCFRPYGRKSDDESSTGT
jgi:hypothetical protein